MCIILASMRKELFWAGIIGISFGLIIAFGVWRINSSIKPNGIEPSPTPSQGKPVNEFKITFDKPSNNDVVTEDEVTVTGLTKPQILINISGEDEDYILESDQSGVFSQNVSLTSGINQIKLTAFDQQGNQSIEQVIVVYSASFEPNTSNETAQESATEQAEIRLKVQEKVEAALNKPKAYIGVVTDIADSTIQIKALSGEIKQISTSDNTTAADITAASSKTIKLADVAIGDSLAAMGYVNGNSVLVAQRILVTNPVVEPLFNAYFGTVTDSSNKSLTVRDVKTGEEVEITLASKSTIMSFSNQLTVKSRLIDVEADDKIIYVTEDEKESPTIRSIFIIPASQEEN